MVANPEDLSWSSHRHVLGQAAVPCWLDCDWLLRQFGRHRTEAVAAYRAFVVEGIGNASPLAQTRHQTLLCDDEFVADIQQMQQSEELVDIVCAERASVALPLTVYCRRFPDRDEAMAGTYLSNAFTMPKIAALRFLSKPSAARLPHGRRRIRSAHDQSVSVTAPDPRTNADQLLPA